MNKRYTYGGMQPSKVYRTQEPEKENQQLKKIMAELAVDNSILKEVVREKGEPVSTTEGCPKRSTEACDQPASCLLGIEASSCNPALSATQQSA